MYALALRPHTLFTIIILITRGTAIPFTVSLAGPTLFLSWLLNLVV